MIHVRHFVLPLVLGASLAACSGDSVTGAGRVTTLTDAQRATLAQKLVETASTTGEGSIAGAFAAAAIVAGAEVRTVTATSGGLAPRAALALPPAGERAAITAAPPTVANYYAVAVQVTETGSPDVMSTIVAWRQSVDGTPTDLIMTLAADAEGASFASEGDSAPTAFGLLFQAPSALWLASTGTTSLRRTSTGDGCRDIDEQLAASGFAGSCKLAVFSGSIDITGSAAPADPENTAQGSASFTLPEGTLGGVAINVTGPAAARALARALSSASR